MSYPTYEVNAKCKHCNEENAIAAFDKKADADRYAKEQQEKRPGFLLTVKKDG